MKKEILPAEFSPLFTRGESREFLSVIVPMFRLAPERRNNEQILTSAVQKALELLKAELPAETYHLLRTSLLHLQAGVDPDRASEGVGLFVAPGVSRSVDFHFPVTEKIALDREFLIKDVLYELEYAKPYLALFISENEIHLYEGVRDLIRELKDGNFPVRYVEEYLYNPPTRGSSYTGHAFTKDFEKDKSELEQIRHQHFFRQADHHLRTYLKEGTPLILIGDKKDLVYFRKESQHVANICGLVHGNYAYTAEKILAGHCFAALQDHLQAHYLNLISDFEEKIGSRRATEGLTDSWRAAQEGNCLHLLIEKDFSKPGFVTEKDPFFLHLAPTIKPHRILTDASDDLILTVLDKGGSVTVVEKGLLADHQAVAMVTRY